MFARGRQVAILDNGTADTRTGAIVGLSARRDQPGQARARVEQLDVIAYGGKLTSRVNGVEVASANRVPRRSRRIGLENAGNNLMYADPRIKDADQRTDRAHGHDPQRPRRPDPAPGLAVHRPTTSAPTSRTCSTASATAIDTTTPGRYTFKVTAKDAAERAVVTRAYSVVAYTPGDGSAGGTVPATLALTLGAPRASAPSRRACEGVHGLDDRERRSAPR